MLEDAEAFSGNTNIDLEGASEMACDCKLWRKMIRHKREFICAGHSNDRGDLIKYRVYRIKCDFFSILIDFDKIKLHGYF